ncbi:MAG: helix-turn-helix domain-containing protein [Actinomycetia bacterium]|nr:helix-turn-helix domain-containing protein [Actinomycetes bacterium]
MEIPTGGIARLHYFVRERRRVLKMSRSQMFARGGPSPSTIYKALAGDRGLSITSLERIDRALGWTQGSAAAVLEGKTPTSQLPPSDDDGGCATHDHVRVVLTSIGEQLQSANQLVEGLLGGSDAR